jgi:hypothetical protein
MGAGLSLPACAGPPFETDDPAPTDLHRWEIYLFADAGGRGAEFDGTSGLDINHGIRRGVQLTVTIPVHMASGDDRGGAVDDVDLGVKYRFLSPGLSHGWSAAVAPILTVPLSSPDGGLRRPSVRLPLWIGWERRGWAIYGGGGLEFRAAREGRDLWSGGVVVTRALGQARIGVELTRHGREGDDQPPETGLAAGCIVPVRHALLFHAAAGPRFVAGEAAHYRFYLALAAGF